MKQPATTRAFTLIELLVVIAILGILASVALSSVTGHRERARDALRLVGIDQINTAIAAYTLEHGVPPGDDRVMYVNGAPDWIPGLVPGYVVKLPSDPVDSTEHSFRYMRQGGEYGLVAKLERENSNHASGDGGVSDTHYEITSGPSLVITDPDESDWRFEAATAIETHLTCDTPGSQVTICHVPPGDPDAAHTLVVGCTALGPEGHSNHEGDYLGVCTGDESPPEEEEEPPVEEEESECPVTITPALGSYVSGGDVQLSWDSSCYTSSQVMLEVRKVTTAESSSYIMIYSAANNDGDYPYQGFPSGLIGSDEWVVRVTDYNTRTNWDESAAFAVTASVPATTHTITATAGAHGSISPSDVVSVTDGGATVFTFTPDEGSGVEAVTVDGVAVGTSTTYEFTNVTEDHTIEITFTAPSVDLSVLTIHGRFVHAFTSVPLADVPIKSVFPPSTIWSTFMSSDENGEFSFTVDTTDILPNKSKPFVYNGFSCYISNQDSSLASVQRKEDDDLMIGTNYFDLIKRGSLYIDPLTVSDVDMGDVPLWPGKRIIVNSDVPVKIRIEYPEEQTAVGNSKYKTQHVISYAVPLDYDAVVKLTDSDGNEYFSPAKRYAREADCSDAVLYFEGGEFTWD